MAFAIQNGNFGSASTWDTGVVPTDSEAAYSNNFTIQVDTSITPNILANTANPYYLANTATPAMTGPTNPLGSAIASQIVVGSEPWRAFDRSSTSGWVVGTGTLSGWIGFQFTTGRVIKQYSFRALPNTTRPFVNFTFEGSMNGSTWFNLDSPPAQAIAQGAFYTSNLLTNTVAYTHYRITGTSTQGSSSTLGVAEVEMTESTSLVVSNVNGGGTFALSTPNTTVSVNSLSALASLITANATSGTNILNITSGIIGITFVSNLINHSGGCNLTITTPSVTGAQGQNGGNCIVKTGLGILTVGNSTIPTTIRGGASNGGGNNNGISSSNGDIVIVGTVLGPPGANATSCHGISQTNGKLTIVGDVTGGTLSGNAIASSSPLALEITGNVTGGSGLAAINKTAGAIIITGNVEARNLQAIIGTPTSMLITGNVGSFPVASGLVSAIAITNTATIEVNGFVAANSTSAAITALGLVSVNGLIYNVQQWQGVFAPRILIGTATTSILYQNFSGSSQIMYVGTSNVSGQPTTNNVRFGTSFGVDNTFVGTCRIPTPNTVRLGAATDNTTGTLIMTPDGFIEELGVSTRPIAVRLQNVSTVETTGDQIVSYDI